MEHLRSMIDNVDQRILRLLSFRCALIKKIAEEKSTNHAPVRDFDRESLIISQARAEARRLGLNPDTVEKIFRLIIDDSAEQQAEILNSSLSAGKN